MKIKRNLPDIQTHRIVEFTYVNQKKMMEITYINPKKRNLVAYLVRMTFVDRLRGEEKSVGHC